LELVYRPVSLVWKHQTVQSVRPDGMVLALAVGRPHHLMWLMPLERQLAPTRPDGPEVDGPQRHRPVAGPLRP
jgi:hypothetical protein